MANCLNYSISTISLQGQNGILNGKTVVDITISKLSDTEIITCSMICFDGAVLVHIFFLLKINFGIIKNAVAQLSWFAPVPYSESIVANFHPFLDIFSVILT